MFNFNTTSVIKFGKNSSINFYTEIIDLLGKKILFVTDKNLTDLSINHSLISILKKKTDLKIFQNIENDPSLKTVLTAIEESIDFIPTGVLGFGGGSVMDVAKIVALLLGKKQNINDIWGINKAKGPR